MRVRISRPVRPVTTARFITGYKVGQITRTRAVEENRDVELMNNQKKRGDFQGWRLTFKYLSDSLKSRWLGAIEEGNFKNAVFYESLLSNADEKIRTAAVETLVDLINEDSNQSALNTLLNACKQKGRRNEVTTSLAQIRNPIAKEPVLKLLKWIYYHRGIEKDNSPQRALCDAAFKCIKNIIREGGTISIVRSIIDQDLIIHEAGLALFKENREIREEVLALVRTDYPRIHEELFSEQDAI